MKKTVFLFLTIVLGTLVAINTGCEDDPKEACEQDLFCDDTVEVTACCTDGADCYYTYNGVDYPDTDEGLANLIQALDCGTTTKSVSVDGNDELAARLEALLEQARILSKQ